MNFRVYIPTIKLDLIIGYYDSERTQLNPVNLSISLQYKNIPNSCMDDDLDQNIDNTIRYDHVISSIIEFSKDKSFYTIEKWCYEITQFLINKFKLNEILENLQIKFTKKNILISEATDGVCFILETKFD